MIKEAPERNPFWPFYGPFIEMQLNTTLTPNNAPGSVKRFADVLKNNCYVSPGQFFQSLNPDELRELQNICISFMKYRKVEDWMVISSIISLLCRAEGQTERLNEVGTVRELFDNFSMLLILKKVLCDDNYSLSYSKVSLTDPKSAIFGNLTLDSIRGYYASGNLESIINEIKKQL